MRSTDWYIRTVLKSNFDELCSFNDECYVKSCRGFPRLHSRQWHASNLLISLSIDSSRDTPPLSWSSFSPTICTALNGCTSFCLILAPHSQDNPGLLRNTWGPSGAADL